ncbi:hypothetical protein [Algoriphagus sp.]|uniref:hypothetical protein n=1 Tax=Algoriphagus sp. TaxID=1872435 RepID=UPI003F719C5C
MAKPIIWIIDTSIMCNILNLPGKNQNRQAVISDFEDRFKAQETFFLPYVVLIETGNHIAQLNGNVKFTKAQEFVSLVEKALNGEIPFTPLKFPEKEDLIRWINGFPEKSGQGIGFGDYSIIQDWEEQKKLFGAYSVRIWSFDAGLQGYES